MTGNEMVFDAVRGRQGSRTFYGTMCTLGTVAKFDLDMPDMARPLRKSAIPDVAKYLETKSYILSSIAVAVDKKIRFNAHEGGRAGTISIPMDATILVNDGRIRCRAIAEACKKNPKLKTDTVPVIMYEDENFASSGQMFMDFRATAVQNTMSTKILHGDTEQDISINSMVLEVPIFKNMTETTQTSISNRSTKLFTLAAVATATSYLTEGGKKNRHLGTPYWKTVTKYIAPWNLAVKGMLSPYVMRQRYVCANGRMLCALGMLGADLVKNDGWRAKLAGLQHVDWGRKNPEWADIIKGGRMSTNKTAGKRAADILRSHL